MDDEQLPEATTDEQSEEGSGGDTYFLPPEVAEGKTVNPGDVLQFTVVGTDKAGNIEVSCDHGDGEKESVNWREELRKNVPKEGM